MSRLWLKTAHLNLFGPDSWLSVRNLAGSSRTFALPLSTEPRQWVPELGEWFADHDDVLRGCRVSICTSDRIAAVAAMPWQPDIQSRDEQLAYAAACLEHDSGLDGGDWLIEGQFTQYGGMGLAYAVQRPWLAELDNAISSNGARLVSVLPVSAAAYCMHRPGRFAGPSLLLLEDGNRTTLLQHAGNRLERFDAEPATAQGGEAGARLLRRLEVAPELIKRIYSWSAKPPERRSPPRYLQDGLFNTAPSALDRAAWSK